MIKNHMEDVVDHILPAVLEDYALLCRCEKCLADTKAITLNNLKPYYTVTENGKLYTKVHELNLQFKTDVIKELTKAIEIVSKNPRH